MSKRIYIVTHTKDSSPRIGTKFTADIAAVNERISKLQALTYEAPV